MKKLVLFVLFVLVGLLLVACGGAPEPATAPTSPAPTAEPTAEPAATTEPAATAEPAAEEPVATAEPAATAVPTAPLEPTDTPEPAVGECLIGTWRVINFDQYLQQSIAAAMEGSGSQMEITSETTGDLLLTLDGTTMTMSENNFQVVVNVGGQTVPVDIEAAGTVAYTVDDNTLQGQVEEVDISDTNTGLAFNLGRMAGEPVTFECEGDMLSWTLITGATVVLERVE